MQAIASIKKPKTSFMQHDCPYTPACTLQKCPNAPICGSVIPQCILDCHRGFCQQPCAMYLGYQKFQPVAFKFFEDGECPICFAPDTLRLKYSSCGHTICALCLATSLRLNERNEANEEDYGYIPPVLAEGMSEEDVDIQESRALEQWRLNHPEQYAAFEQADDQERGRYCANRQLLHVCPLCRSDAGLLHH